VDETRIQKRIETRYLDNYTRSYEEAMAWSLEAKEAGKAISIGLVADAGDVLERMLSEGIIPDILTDQTSAHDPLNGYVPNGMTLAQAKALRETDPQRYQELPLRAWDAT
jgi:urocanate hydratase